MGKKKSRNRAGRNGSRSTSGSFADALQAALNNSAGEFAKSIKVDVEQAAARREADKRQQELETKTKSVLLLPHSTGTGHFFNPLQSGFVNPYTFFPLEETAPKKRDAKAREHSGKLTCTVEVQEWSRLFIPNTSGVFQQQVDSDPDKIHKSFDFFSYDDLSKVASERDTLQGDGPSSPVIPGSELRGMARSVYEQLTNSCLSIVDEKSNSIKRTNLPKHPYRMEYDAAEGAWKLYKTKVLKLGERHNYQAFVVKNKAGHVTHRNRRAYERLRRGYASQCPAEKGVLKRQVLTCDPSASGWYRSEVYEGVPTNMPDAPRYYLHATGEIGGRTNHNHLVLYSCDYDHTSEKPCTFSEDDDLFVRFMRVLDAYCAESSIPTHNNVREIYEAYRAMVQHHETVLVYADDKENPQHLAPSSMSPESFSTRIIDLLKVQSHEPCTGPDFCPACRLFGMVGSKGQLGSRVRFSDAHIRMAADGPDFVFDEPITLAPLSTPRTSATEFYLKRPDGVDEGIWNYDYVLRGKTDRNGNKYLEKDPTPYRDMPGAGISGRKVYVHSPFNLSARYTGDALVPSTQNVTVRPLKQGTFQFEVFFQDLTSSELALLVYALGGMGEGRLQKLGHGRPLGMGSVLVTVTSCETKAYAYDTEQGVVTYTKGTLDAEWFAQNLPKDTDSVARRKLIKHLAMNLDDMSFDDRHTLGDVVSYPKPYEGPLCGDVDSPHRNQTFEWFKNNRGSVLQPKFSNVLGTLSVEEMKEQDSPWKSLPE